MGESQGGADPPQAQIAAARVEIKGDPSAGKETGVEVFPRPVGQLDKAGAIDADSKNVVAGAGRPPGFRLPLGVCEEDCPPVERKARGKERARLEPAAGEPPPFPQRPFRADWSPPARRKTD